MVRKENWPLLLSSYFKSKRNQPFEWGKNDCASFAAGCVFELTGVNPLEGYKYKTEKQAQRIIKSPENFVKMITSVMGEPHNSVMKAKRGDIVFTRHHACGVVDDSGQKIAVLLLDGMKKIPIQDAIYVWSY